MAPPSIPLFYRVWHLYLEPLAALGGAYQLHFTPASYHTFMPSTTAYNPSSQIVYDQLASAYLLFAFIEGVVLHAVDDPRTWRWILAGLLLCDVGHCYAVWCEMGMAGVLDVGAWRGKDWLTNVTFVVPLITRVAFLMGVGMGNGEVKSKDKKRSR